MKNYRVLLYVSSKYYDLCKRSPIKPKSQHYHYIITSMVKLMEKFTDLTEQQVCDVKDHTERELGCEEREEPLGSIHVGLQVQILEVRPQLRLLLL